METGTITLIFIFLASLLMLTLSFARHISREQDPSKKRRRPPGPRGFPFIGSIHHMFTSQPQAALRDLAAKHGPVMHLRLGQVDTLVVSSAEAAREVLQANDLCFASRPSLAGSEILCYGNTDIAFAPYGPYWRALRKLCVLELLSARKVKQLAPLRHNETMALVARIRAAAASTGGHPTAVNVGGLLVSCTNTITALATFGEACGRGRMEQFLSAIEVSISNTTGFCVSDLFPSLGFLDVITGTRRKLWVSRRKLDELFDKIIAECEARWKQRKASNERGEDGSVEDNILSIMLRVRDNEELGFPFSNDNIKAVIADLFTAGTETISTTAEWVMSELTRNPESMAKAQAEVRRAFNDRAPEEHESHMDELHFTRMVIKETMRLHPSVPLLLPRVCRDACDVGGFEIREGTRVLVNAWAIARSPNHWDNPEEFKPARYEENMVDYKGNDFHYLPFGSGRRICPGFVFGLATLELIVARLLYYFNWSLPGQMQPNELNMDTKVGATAKRCNQLHLVATPYKVPLRI